MPARWPGCTIMCIIRRTRPNPPCCSCSRSRATASTMPTFGSTGLNCKSFFPLLSIKSDVRHFHVSTRHIHAHARVLIQLPFCRPAKHYVFVKKYTLFLIELARESNDSQTLKNLYRKLKKAKQVLMNEKQVFRSAYRAYLEVKFLFGRK